MDPSADKRQKRLQEIAEEDTIYQVWARSYEACREAFAEFAGTQPDEIRRILYGYADCGRMMQQRLVNLACDHMRYPDEK